MTIEIKQIAFGSIEYEQELELRELILRKPLGLSIKNDDLSSEKAFSHYGVFIENNKLAACLILIKKDNQTYQIKQMAVDSSIQGRGIGKQLMEFVEKDVVQAGGKKILLNARKVATNFYKELGYQETGEEFTEVTIPHITMTKILIWK